MRFDLLDYQTTVGHLVFTMMLAACLILKLMPADIWQETGEHYNNFSKVWQRMGGWRLCNA